MNLIPPTHPLHKTVTQTQSFDEWRKRFEDATTFEEKFGLLETGLTRRDPDPCPAIAFYFRIADGAHDARFFYNEDAVPKEHYLRACISARALGYLEMHYFASYKDDEGDTHRHFYSGSLGSKWSPVKYTKGGLELFECILSFCTERQSLPNIGNGWGKSPLKDFAFDFACWMLERPAGWSPERTKESEEWMQKIYARATEETPRALKILRKLEKEKELLRIHVNDYPAVLKALEARILDPWGTGKDTRASLEEAYFVRGDSIVEVYRTLEARYEREKRKEKK
jgi:hypothetical protein